MKQRRCLKLTAYLYVPDSEQINDPKEMKYWVGHQPGALRLFDENGTEIIKGAVPFINLGEMLNKIMINYKKMWQSRFKS